MDDLLSLSPFRNQPRAARTIDLRRGGYSRRRIAAAVADGSLVRLHQGLYCHPGVDPSCQDAARARGRLSCVSELSRRGVFVRDSSRLHLHIRRTSARLVAVPAGARVHREVLTREPHPRAMSVDVFDAVRCAVLCQDPRSAIATIDSALHHGLLRDDDLDDLFAALPRRYLRLRRLLDARAESGPESLVRLILRAIGVRFDAQVQIAGVGRVDFLIAGWLIVECDSKQFHSEWRAQMRDRERDLAAAAQGYLVLRVAAQDILWDPARVQAAIRGAVSRGRRVPKAG
ncbi:endonuclease domain-containing protein [Microbacterium sp. TNHR37B]|uniref:endonuclease domain-containing protein n=1 Tax=Microbacterium sp. TNHR37B TaxID=1775956 RepID=UPI0007B24AC0|nr:DUF559 domain-containing protein [Microbacterium sp. TNHR37B]KZE91525.1 hypothetical protein AVP41_01067 [Microbacterium sp. TNHR37B]